MKAPDVDVAIIGAGISGLVTARHLDAVGLLVVVLEARDRVGGRLDSVDGLDLGATWFWPNELRIQRLIADLGVPVHEQHLAGDAMYHDPSEVQRLHGNPIDVLHIRDWRVERVTSPTDVERLTACKHFGDTRYGQPAAEGRLHWASMETAPEFPGHIEGALVAAERAAQTITADISMAPTTETAS